MLVSFAVVFAAEAIGSRIYPPPPGIDMSTPEGIRALAAELPSGAFAFVVAGWLLAAGMGAWVAMRVARSASLRPGIIVGAILLGATIYNLVTIPHPTWVVVAGVIGIPLLAYLAASLARAAGTSGS
jgi:hypothetical protein